MNTSPQDPPQTVIPARVTVVDFDMPFLSIVVLLVKWALAAIPAAIILFIVVGALIAGVAAIGAASLGLGSLAQRFQSTEQNAVASRPTLVVTVRSTANGIEVRNDSENTWDACSLTVKGKGGSIGQLKPNGTTVVALSVVGMTGGEALPTTDVVVHCLRPSDQDARIYFQQ